MSVTPLPEPAASHPESADDGDKLVSYLVRIGIIFAALILGSVLAALVALFNGWVDIIIC
jgi:hypothetical protein